MREERRTRWLFWRCDLEGCDAYSVSHPALNEPDPPLGWYVLAPPKFWRGPSLAFCGEDHARSFGNRLAQPLLGSGQ